MIGALLYVNYLLAIAVLAYALIAKPKLLLVLAGLIVIAAILGFFENNMLLIAGTIIIAAFIASIGTAYNFILLPAALFFVASLYAAPFIALQSMLLGMLSKADAFLASKGKRQREVEAKRDFVQIFAGIVAFLILLLGYFPQTILFSFILVLMSLSTYATLNRSSSISKFLFSLERKNEAFGKGAFWLAFGLVFAMAFVHMPQLLAIAIALFFGDSFATLVGMRFGRHKLIYNKEKSVEGVIAFFVVVALLAYFVVGISSLIYATVGALVEGAAGKQIDDNLAVAIALTVLYFALMLF